MKHKILSICDAIEMHPISSSNGLLVFETCGETEFIICCSISMGAGPALLKSDWPRAGLNSYGFAALCIFPYENRLLSSCSSPESNA